MSDLVDQANEVVAANTDVAIAEAQQEAQSEVNSSEPAGEVDFALSPGEEHQRLLIAIDIDVRLNELDEQIVAKKEDIEERKGELKQLEAKHADLVQELREAIRGSASEPTLFDQPADAAPPAPEGESTDSEDTTWREVSIETLGLSNRALKALQENSIATMGQLADVTRDQAGELTRLNGVGKATADEIADATDRFWSERLKNKVEEETSKGPITETNSETVYLPQDIGLKPGLLAPLCHTQLVAQSQGGRVPKLRQAVTFNAKRYVCVMANIDASADAEALYELRELITPVEFQPNPDDPFVGINVKLDKEDLQLAGADKRILVKDDEGAAQ